LGKGHEFRQSLHGAIVIHQLCQQPNWRQARQYGQIGTRLGMPRSHQYPALPSYQGKNVTRTHKVLGADIAIGQSLGSSRTLLGGNTRGQTFFIIDGNRKGRAHGCVVAGNHGV
jgi:hypothetical protein